VCPQTDILWPSLTPKEHLKLYSILKGVPADDHEDSIRAALSNVRLGAEANHLVSSMTIGAKRRLSVAIASIGSPDVIFLDEPTSSLDPMCVSIPINLLSNQFLTSPFPNADRVEISGAQLSE
jgi:ABC-type multidrug transport system ATPase subunit